MAFVIPGLGSGANVTRGSQNQVTVDAQSTATRSHTLKARTEWRFEVAFTQRYTITLTSGTAEHWGTELAANVTYSFTGVKGAILTWEGCTLDVTGSAEAEYAGEDVSYAIEWLNVHGALEELRNIDKAPRVLVVGPDQSGKSSFVETLTAWAVRAARTPLVVNLDARQGLLSPPGSLTAVAVSNSTDVEQDYGQAAVTGPTAVSIRTPLVYSWPFDTSLEDAAAFNQIITRMALNATGRLEIDPDVKGSGIIVDTAGALNDPKTNYDQLHHVASEFSITHILVVNSERLHADMQRHYATDDRTEQVTVVKIRKPAGVPDRDKAFLHRSQARQIRSYFFGPPSLTLNPHSHSLPFSELQIYRFNSPSSSSSSMDDPSELPSFKSGADDDQDEQTNRPMFEEVAPSAALTASLLAVKFCSGNAAEGELRDSAVMGFVYVAEVDDTRKRIRFLAPHPQRWTNRALVFGSFPDAVPDLIN